MMKRGGKNARKDRPSVIEPVDRLLSFRKRLLGVVAVILILSRWAAIGLSFRSSNEMPC